MSVINLSEWKKLQSIASTPQDLTTLFTKDSNRARKFSIKTTDIYFDYSKQFIDDQTQEALLQLAQVRELPNAIQQLFNGGIVNPTENRPALHTALRLPKDKQLIVNKKNVTEDVHNSLDNMSIMVDKLNGGTWYGHTGKTITDVINIGIGGSDLGPLMACEALTDYKISMLNIHFVSSMDGNQIYHLFGLLNPETTLILVSSKSFSTQETLDNAKLALSWLKKQLQATTEEVTLCHFIGISTNTDKLSAWGIPTSNQLLFWDWVGGRYSLWSVIGFSIALSVGMDNFKGLLAGAHEMDEHFKSTSLESNIPVLLGLLGVWNSSFLDIRSHAILPYDSRLCNLHSYLRQLEMESNGKSATLNGDSVNYDTCPILWGGVGSNGQHAFYQLLHQGTQTVSCDFIATINRHADANTNCVSTQKDLFNMQRNSLANCLAQSRVLAFGNDAFDNAFNNAFNNTQDDNSDSDKNTHKRYCGNQPSTTLLFNELTPKTLGQLIALYEHKTYVMSVIWDINPFDQWGVELGKLMAKGLNTSIENADFGYDSSTDAMLERIYQKNT